MQVVTVRDLPGHRCLGSTQIYLHTTALDLRQAAEVHPVEKLIEPLRGLLPAGRSPLQWAPGEKVIGRR